MSVLLLRWTSLLSSKGGCYFPFLFLSVIFHLNYADYPFFPVWLMLHTSDNHQLATSIPQQSVVLSCERELFLLPTSNFPLHTDDPHAILLWWYPLQYRVHTFWRGSVTHFPWDWSFLKWAGDPPGTECFQPYVNSRFVWLEKKGQVIFAERRCLPS